LKFLKYFIQKLRLPVLYNATLLHRITSKSDFRLKFCHAQKLAFLDTLGSRYQINF